MFISGLGGQGDVGWKVGVCAEMLIGFGCVRLGIEVAEGN